VLGDAYLQKTGARNARLRLEHRADHRAYLVWKANLIPGLFQGTPTRLQRIHPKTKRTHSYVRQQSNASPYLGGLRSVFYVDGRKRIPDDLAKRLKSDIGFAVWFYDDGYYYLRDRSLYLYLGTVSRHEAEIAQKVFRRNFDLASAIADKKGKGYALYFPASEREKVGAILEKYHVPVMAYKIPH